MIQLNQISKGKTDSKDTQPNPDQVWGSTKRYFGFLFKTFYIIVLLIVVFFFLSAIIEWIKDS